MEYVIPVLINDASLLSSNIALPDATESGYTVWAIGQSISIGDIRRYETDDKHWIVRALQAHTTSALNAPTGQDDDTFWVKLREVNRWRMFDSGSTSQSENADSIEVSLAISGAVNAIYFGNLDADSISVEMLDINDNVVYSRTFELTDSTAIYDWYTYMFAPFATMHDLYVNDIPIYYQSTINITITKTGSVAKCGVCAIGQRRYVGFTEYGKLKWGIRSYSVKEVNEFGDTILTRRKSKRIATVSAMVASGNEDALVEDLRERDGYAIVFIVVDKFRTTYIYGFYRDFYASAIYPSHSEFNFEVEELA